jgi:2-keto-4-pentenoate hydratase/2-oxohepta-3-ene-1,7-dioic acid hydratase in catechol pathway
MRFVSVEHRGDERWGMLDPGLDHEQVVLAPAGAGTLREALSRVELPVDLAAYLGEETAGLGDVTVLPPVTDPGKILCVGLNYLDHIAETGRERPLHPVVFTRFADSLVGDRGGLAAPYGSVQFDFEGELAVVIGVGGRHIAAEDAPNHVFGYTIVNDGSVRDFQHHTHQYTPGKNFPASGAIGPAIVTPDEFGALGPAGAFPPLAITTTLNDVVVQRSDLGQLCFTIPRLIEYISSWTTLSPGDIIATGTPGGIGAARDPQLWLVAGDRIEVEIEGIGRLRNVVVDESALSRGHAPQGR